MTPRALKAFPTLLRIGFADALAYRAEFLIWILATNMPLVMLALWNAVAREHPIGGYGQADFVAYFLAALIVRLMTGSWIVWELNYELRHGMLAFRMLRPVHPMIHYSAENLAALPVRGLFALPVALVSLWVVDTGKLSHDPLHLALFVLGVAGAWLLNFVTQAIIGTFSFYLESTLSLFQVWFGMFMLLSGYLFPLDILPRGFAGATAFLPFRYMLSYPVETLLGRLDRAQALQGLAVQWAFIAAFSAVLMFTWRAGVRRFNAYGG